MTKIIDMALIKDIHNLDAFVRGLEISNVLGIALTSIIPVSDASASLSSIPLASIDGRPLISIGYTPIPISQLEEIMWILFLYDAWIKKLELGVKTCVSSEI